MTHVEKLARDLRERAAFHRETGWELMREGDPKLLEDAASELERRQPLHLSGCPHSQSCICDDLETD